MVLFNDKAKRVVYWAFLLLASFFLIMFAHRLLLHDNSMEGQVTQGKIDLKGSLPDDQVILLNGDWEFFSGVLLEPGEERPPAATLVKVPGSWANSGGIPVFGTGTYRLRVHGLQPNRIYGLYIVNPSTAYRLYVNGQALMNKGIVSGDLQEYQPETVPDIALFYTSESTQDVSLTMANFTRCVSGLTRAVALGTDKALYAYRDDMFSRDILLFGAILIMALYHLILFGIKKDTTALYFSIFCYLVAIDSAFSNTQLAFQVFPGLGFETGVRIAYLADTLMLPVFVLYIRSLFPTDTPIILKQLSIPAALVQAILVLVLPVHSFLEYYVYYYGLIAIMGLFLLIFIIKAFMRSRAGAGIILTGAGVVFLSTLNDILHAQLIVQTGYFLSFGFFIFIVLQAVLIALRYSWAIKEVETLARNMENKVKERTDELRQEKERLEAISKMDDMTHIYNKRTIMEKLSEEMKNYRQTGHAFSIVMIDIDYFKAINDQYGHIIGDHAIERIAAMISGNLRKTDICGRFGGEEFMIIMRETDLKGAYIVADKIRQIISDSKIETEKGMINLKASFGLAEVGPFMDDPDELLYFADKALYHAKDKGRNRVECFAPNM